MTRRIYYTDAYRRQFAARVVERGDDGRRVHLDETIFYPTSGGQPHDTGMVGGVQVVDVIDEGDRIAHVLASALPPSAGSDGLIVGEIDWPRRLDHMQQHTGQHLLSAVVDDLYGWKTLSVHFGAEHSTIDVDAPFTDATGERLDAAERQANQVIAEERPVTVTFESATTAGGLRKPTDREGDIRVVTIEGIDRSACGGTHVRSTGGIGAMLVAGAEAVRGGARITFLCGARIVRRAHADRAILDRVAASLSASRAETPAVAAKLAAELRDLRATHRVATAELASRRAREMLLSAEQDAGGVRHVTDVRPDASADDLRALGQAVSSEPNAVYIGASLSEQFVVFSVAPGLGVDAGQTLRDALAHEGGRGGGSPRSAQGTLPDAEAVTRVVERLRSATDQGRGG